eukprot:2081694-Prymnesium_polylepis.1
MVLKMVPKAKTPRPRPPPTLTGLLVRFPCAWQVALGFIFERDAYLRSAWNWLDFVVVVTGLMTIYIRSARTRPRAARPLTLPIARGGRAPHAPPAEHQTSTVRARVCLGHRRRRGRFGARCHLRDARRPGAAAAAHGEPCAGHARARALPARCSPRDGL